MTSPYLSRRHMLARAGSGFGMLSLAGLLQPAAQGQEPRPAPHFAPKAKRVIFLFMNGASVACRHL